ncbi:MAG TPA: glycine cleavage system aminomethyltransferase GcvT [Burkholderiales bacterium]|nr:glycine cleavage system aminomethyltransferase GcvT [Burkholderiales bacterium]
MSDTPQPARELPLHALHVELGAKLVPFAGHAMPLDYGDGILKEHRWCRSSAALFDVSHMGQVLLGGPGAAEALESLTPADLVDLPRDRARYCVLTNQAGGILDDLIVTRTEHGLHVVVNASRREADVAQLRSSIGARCTIDERADLCLLALQGPAAAAVMEKLGVGVAGWAFMSARSISISGIECSVTRSGYTGEDGFEISVEASAAGKLARALLAQPEVRPAGLGARDSLRLEAGLCLYGHDIDETTTPVEAGLGWTISRARRPGGVRAGGYPGAGIIENELANGSPRRRTGLRPEGRMPVREGAELLARDGTKAGAVTSGGFSPTLDAPIAMGYVDARVLEAGEALHTVSRGREIPMTPVKLPFVDHRYRR